jgi:hypothetical protein
LQRHQLGIALAHLLGIALVDVLADPHAFDDGGLCVRSALRLVGIEERRRRLALQHKVKLPGEVV